MYIQSYHIVVMKIVFLGTPDFAIPSLEALLNTSWIKVLGICTQTDKEAGRGQNLQEPPVKVFGKEKGLLILQTQKISKDEDIKNKIKELNPDILITCAFGQILNDEVLNIAPLGVINVHASLLPSYRGAAPINYAILNGEKEAGISIMKTELGLDSGPVLIQEKCNIEENETSIELTKKMSLLGARALIKGLELIKDGKGNFVKQEHDKATKAPTLKKEIGKIDWNKSSLEIHNQVRALQPWPTAYTTFNGKMIKIWETKIQTDAGKGFINETFTGSIIEIKDSIKVKTGDGFIDIYKLQPENKKIMNVKDWINGARIKIGDKFEV